MTNKVKGYLLIAAAVFLLFVLLTILTNATLAFLVVIWLVGVSSILMLTITGFTLIEHGKYDSR